LVKKGWGFEKKAEKLKAVEKTTYQNVLRHIDPQGSVETLHEQLEKEINGGEDDSQGEANADEIRVAITIKVTDLEQRVKRLFASYYNNRPDIESALVTEFRDSVLH
jgi:hypothetical protein